MLQHIYMVPKGIKQADLLQYKNALTEVNPTFKALEDLENEFNRTVLKRLNNTKICIHRDWLDYQQHTFNIKINQLCSDIGISPSLSSDDLMNLLKCQIENEGLKVSTDLKYLKDNKHIHPSYKVLLSLVKTNIFHKQWYWKLIPLLNNDKGRIEISGHWSSYTSYSGRVTATNLNLTSLPNTMKTYVVPSKEDTTIWSIDFNNAELRCVGYLSQDKQLLKDLTEGVDVHSVIGSMIKKVCNQPLNNDELRKAAKRFIFAMLYGAGDTTLCNILVKNGVCATVYDVKRLKQFIYERYSFLETYFEQTVKREWVDTFYGPIYPLVTMSGPQKKNFAFQSMIASALKLLAITCDRQKLEVINLIHDEVWVQVPNSNETIWKKQLKKQFTKILIKDHPNFPVQGFLKIETMEEKYNGKI
ncbi:DNA polymerase [Macrococcoides bohemicum]|uniref:DNA polymerase n=1 Tax=Macrococcoides bohemicum TaxID=1903056 RepID=UPI00165E1DD4|nr:DNA polymerase [Macrococcus bohemicus]MBC9873944.1 hypothetical protein [Macrococcus bohemicus]